MTDHSRVLVLGGTSWLGGAVARRAATRGHHVTCLARGRAGSPPEGVTFVRADRADPTAYDEVAGQDWDAVVDVSWQPAFVRSALARLGDRAGHWVYVSSGSVYAEDTTPHTDETAGLHPPVDEAGPVDWEVYGPAKVACEQACVTALGVDHVTLARAGLIVGAGDLSDRFGYWSARLDRARPREPVLVPPLDAPVQVVDVLDLAAWLVQAAERRTGGAFNLVGDRTTLGAVLEVTAAVSGSTAHLVEATDRWLEDHDVAPWSGPGSLPLWLPQPAYVGFMTRSNTAAVATGLRQRPMIDTVRDALAWERSLGTARERRAGLTADREAALVDVLSTNRPSDLST